ncbi:MAG: hypothetical protein ABIQ30_12865 [Devosia sp.]
MRAFLRILLFGAVGPYVGLLALSLLIGSHTLITRGSPRDFVFGPELLSPGILIVTYSVGGIPALLAGIAASIAARWIAGWQLWLTIGIVGGLFSVAIALALFGGGPEMFGEGEQAPVSLLVGASGAIAAFACAALFDWLYALTQGGRTS